MKKTTLISSLLLLLLLSNQAFTQFSSQGSEFYHGFLQNRTRTEDGAPTHPGMDEVEVGFYIANTSGSLTTNVLIEYLDGAPINFVDETGGLIQLGTSYTFPIAGGVTEYIGFTGVSSVVYSKCGTNNTIPDQREVQIVGNGVVQNKTFRISVVSGPDISVIAESRQRVSREANLVLPKSSLGTDYYTYTYAPDPISSPFNTNCSVADYGGPSEIVIVATENNTVVSTDYAGVFYSNASLLPYTVANFGVGTPITLNQGEAIQFQSDANDLTGVHIWGDKPIAVYSGNMAVNINTTSTTDGAWDNIMEQMIPTSAWGCTYITTPLNNGISDIYRIIASTNGTTVSIDGGAPISMNQSDVIEIKENVSTSLTEIYLNGFLQMSTSMSLTAPFIIEANNGNISVAQYGRSAYDNPTSNRLDPTLNILIPLNQFINNVSVSVLPRTTSSNTGYKEDYISVVLKAADSANFDIRETGTAIVLTPVGQWWKIVSGNSAYSYAVFDVSTSGYVGVNYTLDMPTGDGFNAYVCGFDHLEGYSYPAGMNLDPVGASADFIMCSESQTTFDELYAYGGANYTWSLVSAPSNTPAISITDILDNVNSSNPIFTPVVPGLYEFEAMIQTFDGCPFYDLVTVTVENCCFAATDSNYIKYTTSQTISTNLVWDNKIYIDDNVILTIDGSELDVTNVDVVFGECAGIDFINGAQLRSNNSVYRPCSYEGTWRGLKFMSNSLYTTNGIINECTFKNAVHAIFAESNTIDLRITNNLFSDNKIGILVNKTIFVRSITGNTFIFDDELPDYTALSCDISLGTTDGIGIVLNRARLTDVIGQNDFIYSDSKTSNVFGVYGMYSTKITLTSNKFTNLYKAVYIGSSRIINIEANEFEVSKTYSGYDYRVTLENNRKVNVLNNSFINSNSSYSSITPIDQGAIYLNRNLFTEINNNSIYGYKNGIASFNQRKTNIINNSINETKYVGVYSENDRGMKIACNTLDLDTYANNTVTGIDIRKTLGGVRSVKIISNCIMETNYAIHLESTSGGTIPQISNNYLYNYTEVGLENNGYTGNIGSSSSPSIGAGRNSFITNNGLSVFADILSATPLTSYGNFGVSFINSMVSLNGNNVNSTASCGHQIDLSNSSTGSIESCAKKTKTMAKIIASDGRLQGNYSDYLHSLNTEETLEVLYTLYSSNNLADFEVFATDVFQAISDYNELNWVKYHYNVLNNNLEEALVSINEIQVTNNDDLFNRVAIEKYFLIQDVLSLNSILEIAEKEGGYSEIANNILIDANQPGEYKFIPTKPKNYLTLNNLTEVEENNLTIYPNPANSNVTVEYSIVELTNASLILTDVAGKVLLTRELSNEHQSIQLDISRYSAGVYFVSIKSDNTIINQSKLIKK